MYNAQLLKVFYISIPCWSYVSCTVLVVKYILKQLSDLLIFHYLCINVSGFHKFLNSFTIKFCFNFLTIWNIWTNFPSSKKKKKKELKNYCCKHGTGKLIIKNLMTITWNHCNIIKYCLWEIINIYIYISCRIIFINISSYF